VTVYRLTSARFPRCGGEGARLYGGRWNSRGRAVVYVVVYAARHAISCRPRITSSVPHTPTSQFSHRPTGTLPFRRTAARTLGGYSVRDHQKSSFFGFLPEASNIIAPKAQSSVRSSEWRIVAREWPEHRHYLLTDFARADVSTPTATPRLLCVAGCDRGQRYCREPCQKRMRRRQLSAAAHRYQASEAGKEAHRHRQSSYRQRKSRAGVTHQGRGSITVSPPPPPACLTQCAICGQANRWTNPFYWLPGRRRRPRPNRRSADSPKSYVFT
jgi:hypothetical protein